MIYTAEVTHMCPVAKGAYHGPAPIPEEGKWVQAKQIGDISGFTHGIGWCAPQQGACKLTLNVKDGIIQEALVETIGCSGMTHSAAMASEILIGKTLLEALNTDLVCDYAIGENVEKYMCASYALELADRMTAEEEPQPALLTLLKDFLELLDSRKSAFGTLLTGFQMKALQIAGCAPQLDRCLRCGSEENLTLFSVAEGGVVCGTCLGGIPSDPLMFGIEPNQLSALRFMAKRPITALKGIGLNGDAEKKLRRLFKAYISYHLGIEDLKSESLIL
ncbi:MAG: DNA repair protein RecO [Clostridia bacterium]|nr:DNA repair protein RecO [Clostridia bacterium]